MDDVILEVRDLCYQYKTVTALDHVNLRLRRGRVYGIVGCPGAGKTTLLRIIMGLSFPTSGELYLFGQTGQKNLEQARRRIGSLVDLPVTYEGLNTYQNLHCERILLGLKDKAAVEERLTQMGISRSQVGNSAGRFFSMRQRYGIAAALLNDPEFLVLDEPASGLEPEATTHLRDLFRSLNREKGTSMLITSHIPSKLRTVATDYIVLDEGRILREMTEAEAEAEREALGFDSFDEYFNSLIQ